MTDPITISLALSAEQVDTIAHRVALIVADQVVRSLQSSSMAPITPATSETTARRGDITDGQLRVLQNWRNIGQLETVLAIVVGDRNVILETLTKREASSILDQLTAQGRRAPQAARGAR